MKNKKIVLSILIMLLAAVPALLSACSTTNENAENNAVKEEQETVEMAEEIEEEVEPTEAANETVEEEAAEEETTVFTLEELSKYNGKDGNKAYIAYDGVVYDVSNEPQWKSGSHGGNMAGTDVTENLNKVSHGTSKLNGLEIVGELADE